MTAASSAYFEAYLTWRFPSVENCSLLMSVGRLPRARGSELVSVASACRRLQALSVFVLGAFAAGHIVKLRPFVHLAQSAIATLLRGQLFVFRRYVGGRDLREFP